MAARRRTRNARRGYVETPAPTPAPTSGEAFKPPREWDAFTSYPSLSALAADGGHHEHVEVRYGSYSELLADAEVRLPDALPGYRQRSRSVQEAHEAGWWGTETWEEAVKLARFGWTEGLGRIVDLSDRIEERVSLALPSYGMTLEESGGEVDVAALLSGQRECMWGWSEDGGKRPVVSITVSPCVHSDVSGQTVIAIGAMVVALVDALETTGRRVELASFTTTREHRVPGTGRRARWRCELKHADEPLDRATLAFALANPASPRRIGFALAENLPATLRVALGTGVHYGSPDSIPESEQGDVHVDFNLLARNGTLQAYDWVIEQLRACGVDIEEGA